MTSESEKVSRRDFLKYSITAIAGLIVGGAAGYYLKPTGRKVTTVTQPAKTITQTITSTTTVSGAAKKIKISVACDSGHNFLPWRDPQEAPQGGHFGQNQGPKIEKALGIELEYIQYSPSNEYSLIMADLTSKTGKYNIITYFPTYNGDIMGGEWVVELTPFIQKYEVILDIIPPVYRYLYSGWGGKIYALPYDGDFHALYYRKDIFSKPEIRKKFKDKYGFDLAPPQTYDQYLKIAEFFTGWDWDGDGEVEYGTVEDFKDLTWGLLFDRLGSLGEVIFDEEMNPRINSDKAVKALTDLVKIVQYMPPGALEFGALQVFDSMTKGITAMTLTWPDVGPRAGSGQFPVKGDQVGTALVPGYVVNGTLIRRSWTGVGRVMAISKLTPKELWEPAFRVIKWMYDTSPIWVPSGLNGEDPFADTQTMPAALYYWKKANPAWSEAGILDYLKAARDNYQHGYPDLYIPGASEYLDVLSREIMLAAKGEKKPKDALDTVAEEWVKITKNLGASKMKSIWKQQIVQYKLAGIWPGG